MMEEQKQHLSPITAPLASDKGVSENHSQKGVKFDGGKVRPDLIISGMARAIWAVSEVATFGAKKYTENGWQEVENGITRYTAALDRHRLLEPSEGKDSESGLLHAAHLAWNALARLELMLSEEANKGEQPDPAVAESTVPKFTAIYSKSGDVLHVVRSDTLVGADLLDAKLPERFKP